MMNKFAVALSYLCALRSYSTSLFLLVCFVVFIFLFNAINFVYRSTISRQVVVTRVLLIHSSRIHTQIGQIDIRRGAFTRHWRQRLVRQKLREGCKYELIISRGILSDFGLVVGGGELMPILDDVVRGIDEPYNGCADLYDGS